MPANRKKQFKAHISSHVINTLALLGNSNRASVICKEILGQV